MYKKRKYTKQQIIPFTQETKYFDTAVQDHVISIGTTWTGKEVVMDQRVHEDGTQITGYTTIPIIPSAVGTGYGQIIGHRYNLKQIRIRGDFKALRENDKADVRKSEIVRLIMVLDTAPNGTQAQAEQIFDDLGTDNVNIHSFVAMGQSRGRFKVLADRQWVLQATNASKDGTNTNTNIGETKSFSMFWKPKKALQVTLKGAIGTSPGVTELANANVFLITIKNGTIGGVEMNACCRAYFCE